MAEALVPWSVGPWTALLQVAGRSTQPDAFRLGGAFNMAGVPAGRWTGSDYDYASIALARRFATPLLKNTPIWVGGRLEAGRAYNGSDPGWSESGDDKWRSSASRVRRARQRDRAALPHLRAHPQRRSALYFVWGHPH